MPDSSLGKRVTCPNCDTPFRVGSTPPPSPEPTPEPLPEPTAVRERTPTSRKKPVVAEEDPIPVVAAEDDIPAAEVAEAEDDIPAAEVVDEAEPINSSRRETSPDVREQRKRRTKSDANGSGAIPRAKKARPADDDDDPFAVPDAHSPRQKKKSGGGCAIVLGLVAFLGILVCGGSGVFGFYLWNRGKEELAQATNPFGSGSTDPAPPPVETRKSTETTATTKPEKPKVKSVVDLAKELTSNDQAIRLESANALADMEKRAAFATPDLAKAMRNDPNVQVKRAASRALKNIGPTGERRYRVEAFLYGLGDPDETVRKTAKEGLDELGKLDSRDQPVLLEALATSPSPVVQNAALDTLLNLELTPDEALKTFTPLLKKQDAKELRVKAAEALGRTKVDKTKPERDKLYATLFEALGDDDVRVREAAMKGLTALGSKPDDLNKLRVKLHDKSVPLAVRVWACQSIGDMMPKPASAPQEVLDALAQGDPQLKRAALAALAKLGNVVGAADALERALTDPDKEVRHQALAGLGNLGKEAGTSTIKSKISNMMVDPDPAIRKDAADVLRKLDPEELLRSYSRALNKGSPEQRKEAADALRAIGPEAKELTLADLLFNLSDSKIDAETRFHIALAIVAIDPSQTAPVSSLIAGLKSDKPETRRAAVEALAQLGPAARDALGDLATALKDRDLVEKQNSAKALKALAADIRKSPKAQKDTIITTLITSMDDPKMHADAGAALLAIGPECVDNLINLVKDPNEPKNHPQTVVGVALVLQQFGKKNVSEDASKHLQNAALRMKDKNAAKVVDDVSKALK